MAEKRLEKVPLQVSWLAENGLLVKAAGLLGYVVDEGSYTRHGVMVIIATHGSAFRLIWEDHLNFTVAQLLELNFEPGEFKYCQHCKRLQVDCNQEMADIAAHNDGA